MSFYSFVRKWGFLGSLLLAITIAACGGGSKGGDEAKPSQEGGSTSNLVPGQPATSNAPCEEKKAEPEKIPEGAVRVSAFRVLLGVHYCGASVVNNQNESTDLNVSDFSDAALGLNPLFCNILRQSTTSQSNLVLTHAAPKDASDKLLELYSIEFADNAKPETGNLAFSICNTGEMGCGAKAVRVTAFTAKIGGDEDKLCTLILETQEQGQRKTIPGYVPWTKGSSALAAQQSAVQLCSTLALAKASGKTLDITGTMERPGGLLSDQLRVYLIE